MVLTDGGDGKRRGSLRLWAAVVVTPPPGVATSTTRVGLRHFDVGEKEEKEEEETRQRQGAVAGSRASSISVDIEISIDRSSRV